MCLRTHLWLNVDVLFTHRIHDLNIPSIATNKMRDTILTLVLQGPEKSILGHASPLAPDGSLHVPPSSSRASSLG